MDRSGEARLGMAGVVGRSLARWSKAVLGQVRHSEAGAAGYGLVGPGTVWLG